MNIPLLLKAYRTLAEQEKKQKQLDKMSAEPLNYGIIRDLVNSASHGVVIQVTLKDGTKLDIQPRDTLHQRHSLPEGF